MTTRTLDGEIISSRLDDARVYDGVRTRRILACVVDYLIVGLLYLLGGLSLGIATFRAGVFSRWAGLLWAATALVTPAAALLPHAVQRYAAVPMGITMIWLGVALWTERGTIAAGLGRAAAQRRVSAVN